MATSHHAGNAVRTVADLMRRDVITVSPSTSICDVVRLFRQHGISGAPVLDEDGNAVGVISESDLTWLMTRVVEGGDDAIQGLRDMAARDVMTADLFGVAPDATTRELAAFFAKTGLGRAIVLDHGRLRGIVSVSDLLGLFADA
jgi:CBS domain-containing protein